MGSGVIADLMETCLRCGEKFFPGHMGQLYCPKHIGLNNNSQRKHPVSQKERRWRREEASAS